VPDRFESNNTAATATNLQTVTGTVTETTLSIDAGDVDWFRFTLAATGRSTDKATVTFTHSAGDLDLELYSSNGTTRLLRSAGFTGTEQVSLSGLVAGNYYLRILGYGGVANPSYTLSITAPPAGSPTPTPTPTPSPTPTPAGDRYEDNDTVATAANLSTISSTVAYTSLSIDNNDPDWYRFVLGSPGRTGDRVSIGFTQSLGDLDLELYASNGTTLLGTASSGNSIEQLGLAGLAAGSYYVRVFGLNGASNPVYSLNFNMAAAATGDRFEDNDTVTTATNLSTISGTVTEATLSMEANDPDWYRFTLGSAGRAGDKVAITFTHALGDLNLELYSSDGATRIANSSGTSNSEEVPLGGFAAGTYYARVLGNNGASNSSYTLSITAGSTSIAGDRYENNDTAATAADLRTINTSLTEAGLSLEAGDPDWYKFTLPSPARSGDKVRITFTDALGDLDLQLYSNDGATVLGTSAGIGDGEELGLAGLAAGTYYVQVFGFDGASNSNYSLNITVGTATPTGDRFENNDTAATATDLRTISGTITEATLSLEVGDPDWYKFTLPGGGRGDDKISIDFNHAQGDLDLELYSGNGTTRISSSNGIGNTEELSLAGLASGPYYARVVGYNGAGNPSYTLAISAAPVTVAADRFEDNDTASTATDLRTISGTVTESTLTIEPSDVDWYKFTLGAPGRADDKLSIAFTHSLGDLDLELYASNGTTRLSNSNGVGNGEELSLNGLAAGAYYARVAGYSGVSNSSYALTVRVTPINTTGDRFENNDTAATATDLRTLTGNITENTLSLEANDPDWYKFTLPAVGRSGDKVSIAFTHSVGDLDLELYASDGTTRLTTAAGVTGLEEVSLSGRAAGTYYAKVVGYNGASNSSYSLRFSIGQNSGFTADRWESNNTSATATPIRQATETLNGATITAGDQDWYSFTLANTGSLANSVRVGATGGDLSVRLLNSQSSVVGASTTDTSGQSNLSLANLPAGQYFVNVAGAATSTQGAYDLEIRAAASSSGSQTTAASAWTILVYVDGDNDLEEYAVGDVNEMEAAALNTSINVGVMLDRIGGYDSSNGNWTDSRRGVIRLDNGSSTLSSVLTSIGEADMGRGQTLTDFINWGVANLPAQRYAVIIWDHGGGALGGAAVDESSGSVLTAAEIRQAVASSTLQRVDLLGFDACLMATLEMQSELASVASILIASEKLEPGDGWDYTSFLTQFSSGTSSDAATLGSAIVGTYGTFYRNSETLSSVDLAKVGGVETALDAFVMAMRTAADWTAVRAARGRATVADSSTPEYVDLVSFMTQLMNASANSSVDTAASNVITAARASVLRKAGPSGFDGTTIYFPTSQALYSPGYTSAHFRFLANTTWDDFLGLYFGARTIENDSMIQETSIGSATAITRATITRAATVADIVPDYAETLDLTGLARAFGNDSSSTPYELGLINQAAYRVPSLNIDYVGDVDWYHFNLPAGSGYSPSMTLTVGSPAAGVTARLLNASQSVIATASSSASTGALTFTQLAAGSEYYLEVSSGSSTPPTYQLLINAFGNSAPSDPLADFAESSGGNNLLAKALQVGDASGLTRVGGLRNLSFNLADLQGGASGGDWFRVDSVRTVTSNVNRVSIGDVSNATGNLDLRVYDINGNLLAESTTSAFSNEAVAFEPQVSDIYVQVFSASGIATANYSLLIWNQQDASIEGGAGNETLVDFSVSAVSVYGGPGNDYIDGRIGIDVAIYDATRASSTLSKTAAGWTVTSAVDGTDTLLNIERLKFSDVSVALDLSGNAGNVAKILGAVFGKAAVANKTYAGIGLHYSDSGMSYEALMQLAISARLGASASHGAIVDLLYTNIVGSAPSAAVKANYVALLDNQTYTIASLGVLAANTGINAANIDLVGLQLTGLEYIPLA
jgi:hypothetical protein